ncbi:Flagellar protein FliL (modular protein) [Georgfuchsia toluolica]|uniref:Flagellar protein FliL n=1 Tax=Georgfuchsia toluolica TaxID=424218 RepID=A0A916J1B7_9PROT|nr:flagellar basal body-associated FliL family protein [Georgfuchsia toluolica]CAG4882194.1 Flagellar protein FliL (modular protein) [Georgfuchsia toluolica]
MNTATTANPKISVDEEQKPVRRRKRLPLIIAVLALLAAVGGGASWLMSQEHATKVDEPGQKKESAPIYVPLENITVNLQDEGSDQFLQIGMSLKVSGESTADKLKTFMPEVRNRLLYLLSSKCASELTTTSGKDKLSREIRAEVSRVLEPDATSVPSQDAGATDVPKIPITEIAAVDAPSVAAAVSAAGTETPAVAEATTAAAPADSNIIGVIFTSFLIQ